MSRASRTTLRRIISRTPCSESGVSGSPSMAVTVARTGVSGVRSSCERVARKRSLAILAASASARAACSRSMRTRSSAGPFLERDVAENEDPAGGRTSSPSREIRASNDEGLSGSGPSISKVTSPSCLNPCSRSTIAPQ